MCESSSCVDMCVCARACVCRCGCVCVGMGEYMTCMGVW